MTNVEVEKVRFEEIPKWIPECTSLKKLNLDKNMIRFIKG